MRMNLHLLCQTTCLTAYYDPSNDWLYLDWYGEGTLPAVQEACLALADCYLRWPYSHILNNNERVTGVSWSVAAWLVTDFLYLMSLAGIEYVAWVSSPALPGLNMVQTVLNWLPNSPITSFHDLADAVDWLQHTRAGQPRRVGIPERLPDAQAKLSLEVQLLIERVAAKQRRFQAA
ncbi:MAG: hypothetical protein EOO55_03300 [Hymenobacter sp.]|nr:MAG: hypothetical protein EOO55_03300 [Hymenobacter sp.]